jgi:hypothetical protein
MPRSLTDLANAGLRGAGAQVGRKRAAGRLEDICMMRVVPAAFNVGSKHRLHYEARLPDSLDERTPTSTENKRSIVRSGLRGRYGHGPFCEGHRGAVGAPGTYSSEKPALSPTRISRWLFVAHLCHGEADAGGSGRAHPAQWATQPLRTVAKPRYPW